MKSTELPLGRRFPAFIFVTSLPGPCGEGAGREGKAGRGALAATSQFTQKDSKNEQKLPASRHPVNFAPETALLLLSDDLKLCPSLSPYPSLSTVHGAETSRSQGDSRQCLAHLAQEC